MQSATSSKSSPQRDTQPTHAADLTVLASLRSRDLEALFSTGSIDALDELGPHPRGLVLAVPHLDDGLVARALRALQGSRHFVWEGKSFKTLPGQSHQGSGINRIRYPVRQTVFPYRTCLKASIVDGRPCLAIDYDVPQNPHLVRPIYDEVRRLGGGLYLGRGVYRLPRRAPLLALWFALDARHQDAPLSF